MTVTFKGIDLIAEEKYINLKITGKVNMLLVLIDFRGWTAGAAWEDTKFGVRHYNDINRMPIVGDKS